MDDVQEVFTVAVAELVDAAGSCCRGAVRNRLAYFEVGPVLQVRSLPATPKTFNAPC